jgi:hypothetical protein
VKYAQASKEDPTNKTAPSATPIIHHPTSKTHVNRKSAEKELWSKREIRGKAEEVGLKTVASSAT